VHEDEETWSNGPGFEYAPHSHPYHKTLDCLRGSIEFTIQAPKGERTVRLKAGDRLELPAGTVHSAVVGPDGVTCSELHR
jgi:quercetin dioxygenase-like cupin family protein